VNDGVVQSTLRELKGIAASQKLWLTFGAVVLLFAFTGPFGTLEHLRFLPRLGYWLCLHLLAWSAALVAAVLGDVLLKPVMAGMLWRMMAGSILAAIPIGLITQFMQYAWFGEVPTAAGIASDMLLAVPLCIIFCVISYMALSGGSLYGEPPRENTETEAAEVSLVPQAAAEAAPLLRRLKPENRGHLQHLSVEDHYTLVKTSRGKELILLRFSDALAETGTTAGLQVHRSHWVADDFVASLKRANGKLSLVLADGSEIPVSRPYAAEVRARFG
jgi:DNA-binding LytR/AlgR family response regulator